MNAWAQSIIDRVERDQKCPYCLKPINDGDPIEKATLGSTIFVFRFHAGCIDEAQALSKKRGFDPNTFGRITASASGAEGSG